jgi:hypothetical protein
MESVMHVFCVNQTLIVMLTWMGLMQRTLNWILVGARSLIHARTVPSAAGILIVTATVMEQMPQNLRKILAEVDLATPVQPV